jgi:hypothetical protein
MSHPLVTGYTYGACRLLGHLWHVVPSDWTPLYGVPMTCRCERCNIERRDSVNRNTGEVENRRYVYPTGYLMHRNGVELPHRSDFRLAWLEGEITAMRKQRAERSAKQKERVGR